MKKAVCTSALAVLLMAGAIGSALPASAAVPYVSYNYDFYGNVVESPDIYQPDQIISGSALGVGDFISPSDIYVDGSTLYILDAGNSRIVTVDTENLHASEIYIRENETDVDLGKATGLYADGTTLYIADSGSLCVWCTDFKGNVTHKLTKPDSEYFNETIQFLPRKIVGDSVGNLYVQCTGVYEGLVIFDNQSQFKGFFASERVETTAQIIQNFFWKQFMNSEQRDAMANYVPNEIYSMDMSPDNFLYTITHGRILSGTVKEASDNIRCLNPKGSDILNFDMPDKVKNSFDNDCRYLNFADIAYSDDGFINVVDDKRGKVYQFDENMRLVTAFSGLGGYAGTFSVPCAIETIGSKIAVLDSQRCSVTVFSLTQTGRDVHTALTLYNAGDYTASLEPWMRVIDKNPNFQLAYIGVGNALYNEGDYAQAMEYYELGKYSEGYGNAYREYRVAAMRSNYLWILGGIVLVVAAVFLVKYLCKKRGFSLNKVITTRGGVMLYAVRHPMNGFDEMRTKKKRSFLMSAFILLAFILLGAVEQQYYGKAFVMAEPGTTNILSIALIRLVLVLLFVIANWAFSVLMDGKATFSDIWIFTSVVLVPYIGCGFIRVLLSHFLTASEGVFLSLLSIVGILWSFVLLMSAFSVFHEYEIGKSLFIMVATLVGMLLIAVLGFLLYNLVQNVVDTAKTIFSEVIFRMNA